METNEKFFELRSSLTMTDSSQTQRSRQSAMAGKGRQQFSRASSHRHYNRASGSSRNAAYPFSQQSQQQAVQPVYR